LEQLSTWAKREEETNEKGRKGQTIHRPRARGGSNKENEGGRKEGEKKEKKKKQEAEEKSPHLKEAKSDPMKERSRGKRSLGPNEGVYAGKKTDREAKREE